MCGICGITGSADGSSLARRMVDRIRHRGPDGGGLTFHEDVALAMARLAIVDIAGGQQPMLSDDEQIALVFNGEIYNAPAVRQELQAQGVRFKTRSDTEVILRLYERDPDAVEQELAGMWAFAIHDRRRKRLVLSRDRFGIKPLFLVEGGGAIAFGSELSCFQPLHGRPGFGAAFQPDTEAAQAMIAWAYVPETSTIFRGVRRLAPGTRLTVDLQTREQRTTTFWTLHPSAEAGYIGSLDDACALIEPALKRAVTEHLESDVPIATFLSGGIDSSLVTAWAVEASRQPLTAFSIGFKEPRFDESPFARDTAKHLGIRHEVAYLTESDARAAVPDALLAYDEPFGDSSGIATMLLARTVAQTHKVALAGDGGDEVFAGYRKHQILRARAAMRHAPWARELARFALSRLPSSIDRTRGWTEALRSLRRLSVGLAAADAEAWVALSQVVPMTRAAPFMQQAATGERFIEGARQRFTDATGSELQRTLACDLGSPLANDMLTKVDRASMAASLEARVPFLDHRVAELGVGLRAGFTLPGGKRVLRALHERKFGPRLARRRKMGFGVPVEAWLRGALAPAADALFDRKRLERDGLLNVAFLADGRWRDRLETDAYLVWHALALAAWCEANLGAGHDAVREAFGVSRRAPKAVATAAG
jgi:asparagine synthase (glutamine-hydrolysing)